MTRTNLFAIATVFLFVIGGAINARPDKPQCEAAERQICWFERSGVEVLLPSHLDNPPASCAIPDPPPFVFVRGSLVEV